MNTEEALRTRAAIIGNDIVTEVIVQPGRHGHTAVISVWMQDSPGFYCAELLTRNEDEITYAARVIDALLRHHAQFVEALSSGADYDSSLIDTLKTRLWPAGRRPMHFALRTGLVVLVRVS